MNEIEALVRPNILRLKPYSSARHEFSGEASVFLDANENPFDTGLNRYPDPLQWALKEKISALKAIAPENIFLGNGSDEVIDLLLRIFCEPGVDHILTLPPTYGMYQVCADISNVGIKEVPLTSAFQPDISAIAAATDAHSKLLFLCTPNNPSGNSFHPELVKTILETFPGLVIIDEAYIDFASHPGYLAMLDQFPRLVVMQTFSKAWGLAGIRLGMAFASIPIIQLLNKVKPPYNINQLTQEKALEVLGKPSQQQEWVKTLLVQRTLLQQHLSGLEYVTRIFPSDANFLLVKMNDPKGVYAHLVKEGIIVRDRSNVLLCEGCLRITVGTPQENERLLEALVNF